MKQQFYSKQFGALLCGAVIILSSSIVFAQSNQSTVIVSGSRFEENLNEVPANVKVITREEIANSTSNNIPDVLSQIGGLNVRSTNGGQLNLNATVDMGGYGATANSTTLVLVDGQRINPIDSSAVPWESIPIDSIERIEILQGGASVQYGNGAVGGVINIITNGGKSNINQATVNYGSFNTLINNAILRNTVDQTTIQLTANTSNSSGWRENSAANAYSVDAKLTQALGGIDNVYGDLFYSYTNQQTPGGVQGQVGQGNPQSAKFNNIGSGTSANDSGFRFGGIKGLNDSFRFELDGTYTNRTVFTNNPYYSSVEANNAGFVSPSNNNLQGWQLNISPRIKGDFGAYGSTIIGYEFNKGSQSSNDSFAPLTQASAIAWGASTPVQNSSSANLINQSIYAISRLPLSKKIELSGGYRHQTQGASTNDSNIWSPNGAVSNSQNYSANAGDVALNFNYLKGQRAYIKWNQSYRFPNIDEFWGWDPTNNSRIFSGILRPQTAQTYEAGGNWQLWTSNITASIFSTVSQNEIMYNPSSGFNTNSEYNINRNGVVLDSTSAITSKFNLGAGGKVQRAYYASGPYQGNLIPQVPNLLLNARASYLLTSNWTIGGVINYVGNQHYDASPAAYSQLSVMPSYTVADVYASYKTGKWEGRFTIKNVGNAAYSTYGGYGSVSQPNGTLPNDYYYYPSDPRAYFVSAKYSFN